MFALRRLGYHAVELGRRPTGQTEHPGNTGRVAQNPSARAEAMTVPLRVTRPRGPDRPERRIRGGRVRARHLEADADPRARRRRQPPRARRTADHGRPAEVHRRDAARRHDHLALDRCARRAALRASLRARDGDDPRGDLLALHRHLPPRGDRRARAEGDRARPSRAHGALPLGARPGLLHDHGAGRLAPPALDRARARPSRPEAARSRSLRSLGGRAAHAPVARRPSRARSTAASRRCSTRSSTSPTRRSPT